jgi:ubiquitin-like protein ATG12
MATTDPGSPKPELSSRSSTPRVPATAAVVAGGGGGGGGGGSGSPSLALPIPDGENDADLPLTMTASVVLTALPRDAKNALEVAGKEGVAKG